MSQRRCYKENEFIARIQGALNIDMPPYTCSIVNKKGMVNAMSRAGWNKSDTQGVVGFHVDDRVYVLEKAPWTTLHELIHRAGVNADRINRHLAEGLTELIASALKTGSDEHKSTYPSERRWTEMILKKLGMSPLELGEIVAKSKNPPRTVAELFIQKGLSQKPVGQLIRSLKPQVKDAPSLNREGRGSCTRIEPSSKLPFAWWEYLGLTLIGIGLAKRIRG